MTSVAIAENPDLRGQIAFVLGSVEPFLNTLDEDRLSPTWGCAHLAYWRDKTSDVADMRRQEMAFALALLYRNEYPGSNWRGDKRLVPAIRSLIAFWAAQQYPDGSFDEWYKGERAFAAAAFTCHAMARTLSLVADELPEAERKAAFAALRRVADWLTRRDDLFKTNHQAVGVAALAFAAITLGDARYEWAARAKLDSIIAVQTEEGWFPEVGHMDAGYGFLTAEFVAMAMDLWKDWGKAGPFVQAFDFSTGWVHPDLTLGDEYGVCHNPYVSRITAILLAPFSGRAAGLIARLIQGGPGFRGFANTLGDELRLPRWSFQPLLAWDYLREAKRDGWKSPDTLPLEPGRRDEALFAGAGLLRIVRENYSCVAAPAAGGLIRLFSAGKSLADHGYALRDGKFAATNQTYSRKLGFEFENGAFAMECPIAEVKRFMPPYLARVALRLLCSTALGSRLTRRMIDVVRKRKGTAINQSSANLAAKDSEFFLSRRVEFAEEGIRIEDRLSFRKPWPAEKIFLLIGTEKRPELWPLESFSSLSGPVRTIRIVKQLSRDAICDPGSIKVEAG